MRLFSKSKSNAAASSTDKTARLEMSQSVILDRHFSHLFFAQTESGMSRVGLDRRDGSVWLVKPFKKEKQYIGKKISYDQMNVILDQRLADHNEYAELQLRKFKLLNFENWQMYAYFVPGNCVVLHEFSGERLGAGMQMGTIRDEVGLLVGEAGYTICLNKQCSGTDVWPIGFFASQTCEEVEAFLRAQVKRYISSELTYDMSDVIYQLCDSDEFLKKQRQSNI